MPTLSARIVTVAASTPEAPRKSEGDCVELADGRLLLTYTEFAGTGGDASPTRLVAVESADGGATWWGRRVLAETAHGDVNVYSPNLLRLAGGGILFVFIRQHSHSPRCTTLHAWRSDDEGASFAPLAEFAPRSPFLLCNAVAKQLSSGRIVLPVARATEAPGAPTHRLATAFLSDDGGRTWRRSVSELDLPMRGAMEPHAAEAAGGGGMMVMRNQLGSVFASESRDGGETWSKPRTTGLSSPESCPCLTRVPSTGDLLLIWNHSEYDPAFASHFGKRSPLSAAISRDGGRTWGSPRDIESDPGRAFSNPGCRFTADGTAIVNYWTCEYLPSWRMQDRIDLRVAAIDTAWFYGR